MKTIFLRQTVVNVGAYLGGVAGASVPATAASAGDYYLITAAGTSQGKTWAVGELALYEGTSGNWTRLAAFNALVKVAMPTATADLGNPGEYAVDAEKMALYVNGTGWVFFPGYQI
jgi:hypothetical protein